MKDRPHKLLLLNDARGQYIPRDFTLHVGRDYVSGISDEDWEILAAGPDHEHYWDTWSDVEQKAVITDDEGNKYTIHNDSDCFLVPVGMEWSDDADDFVWPEEEQYDERI